MSRSRIDRSTVLGLLVAVAGVMAALLLDGGSIKQILQPTAALIVFAGTLGAVMIQFPTDTLIETVKQLPQVLLDRRTLCAETIEVLVGYCVEVRRSGMLQLDSQLAQIEDHFLRKALTLAVDGAKVKEVRDYMEVDLDLYDEREYAVVKVLDSAGGFAPTLGIMGAVLGLIQVMQRIDNVAEIGRGIAVAFVSTLYGLALANLVLIPLAGKLRVRMRQRQLVREMTLEGVIYIMEGIGPRGLKEKLECYLTEKELPIHTPSEKEMVAQ
jgi:chemotaxis protein MotA